MHDDPFARAVARVDAAEKAERDAKIARARSRFNSGHRKAFRIHLTVFIAVNLMLFAIWLTTWQLNDAPGYPWFIWPLFGWGIGLAAHWAAVRDHLRTG